MPKSYCPYFTDLNTGEDLRENLKTPDVPTPEEEGSFEPNEFNEKHGVVSRKSKWYKHGVHRVILRG